MGIHCLVDGAAEGEEVGEVFCPLMVPMDLVLVLKDELMRL